MSDEQYRFLDFETGEWLTCTADMNGGVGVEQARESVLSQFVEAFSPYLREGERYAIELTAQKQKILDDSDDGKPKKIYVLSCFFRRITTLPLEKQDGA